MLKELGGAAGASDVAERGIAPQPAAKPKAGIEGNGAAKEEESFQETIKKTMERMQASGASATAATASAADNPDDLLAEMMKAMQASGLDGDGGEENFSKLLLGMMEAVDE